MKVKLFILLLVASNCYSSCAAALRRTPKVYNALITTDDENLTASRAYPVIQPTIHETGYYPFGGAYHGNPFGLYSPLVRFGQPIAPGLLPRQQFPYPLAHAQFPPQFVPQPSPNAGPSPIPSGSAQPPANERAPTAPAAAASGAPTAPGSEKLPLNELGLPPALIPLPPQYPPATTPHRRPISPINLPPYGFGQYPLIYDPVTGYREQYLPPFGYYPGHNMFAVAGSPQRGGFPPPPPGNPGAADVAPPASSPPISPAQLPETTATTPADTPAAEAANNEPLASAPEVEPVPSFESIKNGSKSKDSDVPDVPPPPIPSGAKSVQT